MHLPTSKGTFHVYICLLLLNAAYGFGTEAGSADLWCYNYKRLDCDKAKIETAEWRNDPRCIQTAQKVKCNKGDYCNGVVTMDNREPPFINREVQELGCFYNLHPYSTNTCRNDRVDEKGRNFLMTCFCNVSLCNSDVVYDADMNSSGYRLTTDELASTTAEPQSSAFLPWWIFLLIASAIIAVVGGIVFVVWWLKLINACRPCHQDGERLDEEAANTSSGIPSDSSSSDRKELLDMDIIDLTSYTVISKGRFGSVSLLQKPYEGYRCIAKSFYDEKQWLQEKMIYTQLLTHDNIVRYLGATRQDSKCVILLEYSPHGSLNNFLKGHNLNWENMLTLMYSMMKGLAYLHEMKIATTCNTYTKTKEKFVKPPIAHRDLKSCNIILGSNFNAMLADFNLAIAIPTRNLDDAFREPVGTSRYKAPEILQGNLNLTREALLASDVYSASLVLWEILSRWEHSVKAKKTYKLPYEAEVGSMPTDDSMLEVVVHNRKRPIIECAGYNNKNQESVDELISTIQIGWDDVPELRLTAAGIEARLERLVTECMEQNQPFGSQSSGSKLENRNNGLFNNNIV